MTKSFDIQNFLPYLLNRAAEHSSAEFQNIYKRKYGMLRTEWRVMFHLGRYGDMTAHKICELGDLHRTKVSRAVSALEKKRFIGRVRLLDDRRSEMLSLTRMGSKTYQDLSKNAETFHEKLTADLSDRETTMLIKALHKLIKD